MSTLLSTRIQFDQKILYHCTDYTDASRIGFGLPKWDRSSSKKST